LIHKYYWKKRYQVSADAWTPIVPPYACNFFALKTADGAPLLLRTDVNDETTEDYLAAYAQESVTVPILGDVWTPCRFDSDHPALYVKLASGVGPVVVTWVK
jgi:hypothetical protein